LSSDEFKDRRKQLKQRLSLWSSFIEGNDPSDDAALDKLDNMIAEADKNISQNMKNIHEAIRPLETAYRGVDLFFQNAMARPDSEVYVYFANAGINDLNDPMIAKSLSISIARSTISMVFTTSPTATRFAVSPDTSAA